MTSGELKGLAASMGTYDDKNPCKRAVILGKLIQSLEQQTCDDCKYNTKPRHAVCNSCICGDRYVKDEESKQHLCEDAVSRKIVLDNIDAKLWEYCTYLSNYNGGIGQRHASALAHIIREAISELPSVQIEPKTGHWVKHETYTSCSCCGKVFRYKNVEHEFCSKCGAKIVDEEVEK